MKKKDAFVAAVDGLFDGKIEVTPDGVAKDALKNLLKDGQEATMKFESKQNIVNILDF